MKRFVLFVVALSSAVAWAQVVHPDLKSGKEHVSRIVIMPLQAEIEKEGMKGGEPMTEEARELEKSLTPVIADVLRKLNVTVNDTAFTSAAFDKDPEFRYTTDDLQKKFDAILDQLTRKSNDVRKGRFTLGDSVAKLGDLNADALLFVRASGCVFHRRQKGLELPIKLRSTTPPNGFGRRPHRCSAVFCQADNSEERGQESQQRKRGHSDVIQGLW